MIVVGSVAAHHVGLYVDPQNPKQYQIPENESNFSQYIAYKEIRPVQPTEEEKKSCKKML